ncbi:hypothetical protein [Methanoregula sp.]|uniref:hypothetical protein n=1 Tax=Methanoregula sp. TaxID=2052170 RepID=UPI003C274FA3
MMTPEICPSCGVIIEVPATPQETPVSAPSVSATPQGSQNHNHVPANSQEIRNPVLAACLSFFMPGWGQWYNGKTWTGLKYFVVLLILSFFMIGTGGSGARPSLIVLHLLLSIVVFAITIYGLYDAYKTAQRINTGEVPFSGKSRLFWIPVILAILMIVVLLALLVMAVFMFGMANHAGSNAGGITHTKVVAVTALKSTDAHHVIVTYQGGQDADLLNYISVTEADNAGNHLFQRIGLANQTTPLEIGSFTTFSGVDPGQDHIEAFGYFSDNTEQTLLDTWV